MNKSFEEGYMYGAKLSGTNISVGFANGYISEVEKEISELEIALNNYYRDGRTLDSLKGLISEPFHAHTYNIDAAVKGIKERAYVLHSTGFGSVDVSTSWGDDYGLKYFKTGDESARQQAKSLFEAAKNAIKKISPENQISVNEYLMSKDFIIDLLKSRNLADVEMLLNDPLYASQIRLVPSDQLEAAKQFLLRKIATESTIRPEQVERYRNTLENLTDRIHGPHATESIPLSEDDSRKIAEAAREGKFVAKEYHISPEELIKFDDILRESLKAGASAAVVYCALRIAPEIIKLLKQLANDEGIDMDDIKNLGITALSSSGQGFLRGTIAASITATFKAGIAGELAKKIDPFCISMAVTVIYDTINNAIKMSCGKMSKQEFTEKTIKQIYVAIFAYCVGYGSASLFCEIPPLSAIVAVLGNLIGAVVGGFIYDNVHSVFLSFCAESGYEFFGMVKQDYSLPDFVLKDMGFDVCEIDTCEIETCEIDTCEIDTCEVDTCEVDRCMKYYIRRGIIGINRIGYIV